VAGFDESLDRQEQLVDWGAGSEQFGVTSNQVESFFDEQPSHCDFVAKRLDAIVLGELAESDAIIDFGQQVLPLLMGNKLRPREMGLASGVSGDGVFAALARSADVLASV
jgi:hypothetical protein